MSKIPEYRITKKDPDMEDIEVYAPRWSEKKEWGVIASISPKLKEVYPTHGYFHPHPYSKISMKIAKEIGYKFNNN